MPGSTGPDLNTYIIPEVQLGDTFNYWRDSTNTAIYKLNKLKIYDAVTSASIGATYGTTGAWQAVLQPTITSGHTFSAFITLPGGITTTFLFASSGVTLWSNLYVNGGATFASTTSHTGVATFGAGVTVAGTLDVGGVAKFGAGATVAGTFDAGGVAKFQSGVTLAGTLDVTGVGRFNSGVTFASITNHTGIATFATGVTLAGTLDVTGVGRFNSGVTVANTFNASGVAKFGAGVTVAGTLDVTGTARFNSGLTLSTLTVNGISRFNGSNVSIGTAAPGASLDVSGQIRVRQGGSYTDPVSEGAGIIAYDNSGGDLTISARSSSGTTQIALRTSNSGTGAERMRISGAGDVSLGDQSSAANTLRYFDIYNTHNGTATITGSNLRLITRNSSDSTTSIVDIVKYRNGSFNLANNDTGNSSVSTNFLLNATNIMNLSLTAVAIGVTSASTSTTTGALTVGGGVGVAGALYAAGITSSGTLYASSFTNGNVSPKPTTSTGVAGQFVKLFRNSSGDASTVTLQSINAACNAGTWWVFGFEIGDAGGLSNSFAGTGAYNAVMSTFGVNSASAQRIGGWAIRIA